MSSICYIKPHFQPAPGLWDICAAHSPIVQPQADGGVFCDMSGCGPVEDLTAELFHFMHTRDQYGVIGIATNSFVAKIAADRADVRTSSPREVASGTETAFLAPLSVQYLWNVPNDVREQLAPLGITTIGQLSRIPLEELSQRFGVEMGHRLHTLSFGRDKSRLKPLYPPAALEERITNEAGLTDRLWLNRDGDTLAFRLGNHLRRSGRACGHLWLSVKTEAGAQFHRHRVLKEPSSQNGVLAAAVKHLLQTLLEEIDAPVLELRLRATRIGPDQTVQCDLFQNREFLRKKAIEKTIADVNGRFGPGTVYPAYTLPIRRRERMRSMWEQL